MNWQRAAILALQACDPRQKCSLVHDLWRRNSDGQLSPVEQCLAPDQPGRPPRPLLVTPTQVPRRRLGSEAGRAALVHAVAHIEFNAINLALDAALRFPNMPAEYYHDWLSVAEDEARHFELLSARLADMHVAYGDLPAHNGLWEMAEATAHDPLLRMALVPRVLEARGLDVTPGMIERLQGAGDTATVSALRVILHEEERHVAIGSRWFVYLCEQRALPPEQTFIDLLETHYRGQIAGPFNLDARRRAGFSSAEMARLCELQPANNR
ncbi:MAG: ferritin-like domain-containing protein [Wenzhouxiangellaceae bacterium]